MVMMARHLLLRSQIYKWKKLWNKYVHTSALGPVDLVKFKNWRFKLHSTWGMQGPASDRTQPGTYPMHLIFFTRSPNILRSWAWHWHNQLNSSTDAMQGEDRPTIQGAVLDQLMIGISSAWPTHLKCTKWLLASHHVFSQTTSYR